MMKKIAAIARCAVFLLILAFVLGAINDVLMPNYNYFNSTWPSSTTYNQFYRMEEDTIDVLFMGSSVCMNAFSPMQLYKDYGIRSFNLGSEQQSVFMTYYWLKEALRYHKPKAIVVDALFCSDRHPEYILNAEDGLTRKSLDAMRFSSVKAEAVREFCALDKNQSELSYYLTNIRYHDRWKQLEKSDFYEGEYAYSKLMGFAPGRDETRHFYISFNPEDPNAVHEEFHELSMVYLDKIAALCQENGIEMILVELAGNEMNDGIHNRITAFAKEHGLDFYNFCETEQYNKVGAVLPEESILLHANLKGSIKMTQYMGKLLSEKYGVEGVQDHQWEEQLPFYDDFLRAEELPGVNDLETYLSLLPNDECTVFMAVKEDAYTGMPQGVKEALKKLGLYTEWDESMYRQPYIAILSGGRKIEGARGYQGHSDMFEGGKYDVLSIGYQDGNVASVKINDQEYALNRAGLNIVVYSHYLDRVIDSVNFNISEGEAAYRKTEE